MKRVCGLDVHKDNAFVCILGENGEKIEFKTGVLTVELDSFRDKLVELGVGEVAMESTAVYWMPIWRILESDFRLYLVNPLSIKQLPGRKSDVKDAEWIATCLQKGLIRGSFVPPLAIQQLRQYNRRLFDLNKQSVYVQNKIDAALQRCNIRISNYVSNIDTKSYLDVVELLSEGISSPELLTGKIHKRTINKHGRDTIKAALTGVVTDVDSYLIRQYKEELDMLKRHKLECLSKMREMCEELYPEELKRIEEIPGVSAQSATQIIAEIGTDMKMFLTARTVVAWAGLKPRNDGSNGKIKSRRITHGNKYLRKILIECAWAASHTKDCFFSSFSYRMVTVRKKGRLKVQVAIARKLLVVIWNLLAKGVQYSDRLAQIEVSKEESSDAPQG
ncbi:MAG: IS110 family transposase [Spirochaetia bacterium]|nr:IS110 family transposase [Spirochaetia bacterium]